MNRQDLITNVRNTLNKSGFYLSEETDTRHISFDVVARRDEKLLFVKVLTNVDSFNTNNATELKTLSHLLDGVPLLVGLKSTAKPVEHGVLYLRHSVGIMSPQTLYDYLIEGVPPMVYSAPGGFYVRIDGVKLGNIRNARGVSLGELAQAAGVSRKAIQLYENGMAPTLESAMAMEDLLETNLIMPLDPFTYDEEAVEVRTQLDLLDGVEKEVLQRLTQGGYEVVPTHKCPFNALTLDTNDAMLTAVGGYDMRTKYRLQSIANISKVTERKAFYVLTEGPERKSVEGVPTINAKDLKGDPNKIRELILKCMEQ